jgi:hypothetical protein
MSSGNVVICWRLCESNYVRQSWFYLLFNRADLKFQIIYRRMSNDNMVIISELVKRRENGS